MRAAQGIVVHEVSIDYFLTMIFAFLYQYRMYTTTESILLTTITGSVNAIGVLSQLHCRAIPSGVQHALLYTFTYCCFRDFLGQIYSLAFKETLGMFSLTEKIDLYQQSSN